MTPPRGAGPTGSRCGVRFWPAPVLQNPLQRVVDHAPAVGKPDGLRNGRGLYSPYPARNVSSGSPGPGKKVCKRSSDLGLQGFVSPVGVRVPLLRCDFVEQLGAGARHIAVGARCGRRLAGQLAEDLARTTLRRAAVPIIRLRLEGSQLGAKAFPGRHHSRCVHLEAVDHLSALRSAPARHRTAAPVRHPRERRPVDMRPEQDSICSVIRRRSSAASAACPGPWPNVPGLRARSSCIRARCCASALPPPRPRRTRPNIPQRDRRTLPSALHSRHAIRLRDPLKLGVDRAELRGPLGFALRLVNFGLPVLRLHRGRAGERRGWPPSAVSRMKLSSAVVARASAASDSAAACTARSRRSRRSRKS